ncbi:hypothetical protein BLNAU_24403 [Blattamonas nauphoetae]|uniref:Tc1-like transposase DDE domain-containing protein n=1 Tax=Blattamonas nauphoetae TaxID=2049346 RepID=A0ABQ9WMI8_9EUKA|nr:hypothetical protein BLNAU_24403 [Blattamonas nauphoetae]
MTGDYYLTILQRHLVQNGSTLCGPDFVNQPDNHPAHKTGKVQDYLERLGITVMSWPPNSPDFSPIENMFAVLKREYPQALFASMPDRMQAGKRARRGATIY